MCGIVGAISTRSVENILIQGLKRLEYRGYDSAGVAVLNTEQKLERLRAQGKVNALEKILRESFLQGNIGIAHTRWATHGAPCEQNAHPLISHNEIALVHNGIIENHEELRQFLLKEGYQFHSETDTETVVHLLHWYLQKNSDPLAALQSVVKRLEGAYALGILSARFPDRLLAVRHGSPLIIGKGLSENFFASDLLALLPVTQQFIHLEEGEIADVSHDAINIYSLTGERVSRAFTHVENTVDAVDRGPYRHYMNKEIYEQPRAIAANLEGRVSKHRILENVFSVQAHALFQRAAHIQLVACGTSYHAAMVARYWIESFAGIPCSVEIASEFRYRKCAVPANSVLVLLSQSGETADTLAVLQLAKALNFLGTLAICNVQESALVRGSDFSILTRAGTEIGVASTKAFTTQLVVLLLFALVLGRQRHLSEDIERQCVEQLHQLSSAMEATLELDKRILQLAEQFVEKSHALYLGRGLLYPIALEGALKLKEISYIHAEGYPAGELKHGPLALVDHTMPVVTIVPNDASKEKMKSNLQAVAARSGKLIVFTDAVHSFTDWSVQCIEMPSVDPILAPMLYSIPMQLLAYHVAVLKGTDVDQPRNLAKSVTVE